MNYIKSSVLIMDKIIIRKKRISSHKITVYKNAKEGFIYLVVKITPFIKLLYLFQWIPLFYQNIHHDFFFFRKLIWNSTKPRVRIRLSYFSIL